MADEKLISAAVLVIGDEILSGRTKDSNSGYIADFLTAIGIDLKEIRVVADEMDDIVAAVRALSERYTYVFSTGGIGPTHDDITADAMAKAFGVGIDHHPDAVAIMKKILRPGAELNEARLRMARIPLGASLIIPQISAPPGFKINNVHVFAGVPSVMKAMMEEVGPSLSHGTLIHSRTVAFRKGEGTIAARLGAIQDRYEEVSIGSYPTTKDGLYVTNVVLRSRNAALLEKAEADVIALETECAEDNQ